MDDQADSRADAGGLRADGQWLTYAEAGARLGISAEAVRKRAQRGTLPSERRGEHVMVWLASADVRADASGTNDRERPDAGGRDVVAVLEAENAHLRELLAAEIEARRRADLMNAALLDRLPRLPAGDVAVDAPVAANQGSGRVETPTRANDAAPSRWARLRRWIAGD